MTTSLTRFEEITFEELARRYCDTQVSTPEALKAILLEKKATFSPDGFMLLRCQMMDSSLRGSHCIVPYGPNNTFKSPPEGVISPRGRSNDVSTVVAVMRSDQLDQ